MLSRVLMYTSAWHRPCKCVAWAGSSLQKSVSKHDFAIQVQVGRSSLLGDLGDADVMEAKFEISWSEVMNFVMLLAHPASQSPHQLSTQDGVKPPEWLSTQDDLQTADASHIDQLPWAISEKPWSPSLQYPFCEKKHNPYSSTSHPHVWRLQMVAAVHSLPPF